MNIVKLSVAVLFGLVLGLLVCRAPKVKAQETGYVQVVIVPVSLPDASNLTSQKLPGGEVSGISCLPKPTKYLPAAAVCYVATTLK